MWFADGFHRPIHRAHRGRDGIPRRHRPPVPTRPAAPRRVGQLLLPPAGHITSPTRQAFDQLRRQPLSHLREHAPAVLRHERICV